MTNIENILTTEKMISVLEIDTNDDLDISLSKEHNMCDASSMLMINSKEKNRELLLAFNFEHVDDISTLFEIEALLEPDGLIVLPVSINNSLFKKAIDLINKYMKVFMAIYTVDQFTAGDSVQVNIKVDYCYQENIKIIKVSSISTALCKYYSWYSGCIEIGIEDYINKLLNKINISHLDENSDIAHVIELLKMQDLIDEMDMI